MKKASPTPVNDLVQRQKIIDHVCFEIEFLLKQVIEKTLLIGEGSPHTMSGLHDSIQMHQRNLIEFFFRDKWPYEGTYNISQTLTLSEWESEVLVPNQLGQNLTESWSPKTSPWPKRWKEISQRIGHLCKDREKDSSKNIKDPVLTSENLLPFIREFLSRIDSTPNDNYKAALSALHAFEIKLESLRETSANHVRRLHQRCTQTTPALLNNA